MPAATPAGPPPMIAKSNILFLLEFASPEKRWYGAPVVIVFYDRRNLLTFRFFLFHKWFLNFFVRLGDSVENLSCLRRQALNTSLLVTSKRLEKRTAFAHTAVWEVRSNNGNFEFSFFQLVIADCTKNNFGIGVD